MSDNNSKALFGACVHGLQPDAVKLTRDEPGTGLFIYLDPDQRVSIRIDVRPGYDDWEQSRLGLEKLATVALAAASEIGELQAAQVTESSGG
jgi:hypothetical protein